LHSLQIFLIYSWVGTGGESETNVSLFEKLAH
jgi:hypothetical protein